MTNNVASYNQVCMLSLHQVHLSKSLAFSGIPPMFSVSMHLVELILQDEAPLCYSAFKLSGFTPSQVVMIVEI